jgi:hypothetical protein
MPRIRKNNMTLLQISFENYISTFLIRTGALNFVGLPFIYISLFPSLVALFNSYPKAFLEK